MKKLGILFTILFVVAISLTSCKKVETAVFPQDTANVDSLENLQILCPNCHTMTDNYRGKNIGKIKIIESASGTTTTCTLETY